MSNTKRAGSEWLRILAYVLVTQEIDVYNGYEVKQMGLQNGYNKENDWLLKRLIHSDYDVSPND